LAPTSHKFCDTRGYRGWWAMKIHSWCPVSRLYQWPWFVCSVESENLFTVRKAVGRPSSKMMIVTFFEDFYPFRHLPFRNVLFSALCYSPFVNLD
jgi:hypothetical protein